jgi:hypothetical protein
MAIGKQNLQSPQRDTAVLALRKTGAGTPVISGLCANFCTITDNGVGDYTIAINVDRPFAAASPIISSALPHSSGIIRLDVATSSNLVVSVKCFAVDGTTPAELNFDLICIGTYASDLQG